MEKEELQKILESYKRLEQALKDVKIDYTDEKAVDSKVEANASLGALGFWIRKLTEEIDK